MKMNIKKQVKQIIDYTEGYLYFKQQIEVLANWTLENSGVHRNYSKEDMLNATLIFQEVIMALTYSNHKDKINFLQMETIAEELGKNIHQNILLGTGIDMKKIYAKDN